ncbi:MAG: cysteine proteinase [Saprospiraceae bacterium]|nr:MAG: cysteine proteinase [Saprospiraceae bacterium]
MKISIAKVIVPCFLLLSSFTLEAQSDPPKQIDSKYFEDVSYSHLPIMVLQGRNMDAKPFDADGDGDLDIMVAGEHTFNILLINDGKGKFTEESVQRIPLNKRDSEDIAIADFDGDGDLDIILVSEDDQLNEYYLNDGTGHFKDVSDRLPVTGTSNGVLTLDVNEDGWPDLIIGNAGQNNLLINDGKGGWIDETEKRLPKSEKVTQDVEAGDIDGDGDLDLIFGNEDDNEVLVNTGKGIFKDETKNRLPFPAGQWETREADLGDIDGDGDLDLYLANVNFRQNKDAQNRLFINDGKGVFTDQTEALVPAEKMHTVDGDFADLDGDGDLDIITGNGFGNSYNAYFNNGSGKLRQASAEVFPLSTVGDGIDIEMADFNGDGQPDLYLCNFLGHDFLLFGKKK